MPTTARSGSPAVARGVVRSALIACLAGAAALVASAQQPGDDSAEISRMIRDASRALQAGNAARFLSYFDEEEFAGYAALRSNVVALTSQRQIASSIEITELEAQDRDYDLRISWLLQLTYTGDPGPVEARRELVSCRLERRSSSWTITGFEPVSLFRP